MQIQILENKFKLTDDQRDYTKKKIGSLKKYADRISDEATLIKVEFTAKHMKSSGDLIVCQVTMSVPRATIRAEIEASKVEEAVDLVEDKLRKQIEKYKEKLHRRDRKGRWIPVSTLEKLSDIQDEVHFPHRIIRRKQFDQLKPMHEEEALEQMELLGHNFFAFWNIDTDKFSVVYKRKEDLTYGLIELDKEVGVRM